ncbi:MAG: 16S rRNA (cytosine(1402)-N(4))-methyltransferase RsmH [Candidatus Omnitrophica bacterium]|nr:16S rRNA (cytosine(1402)-N(4))-methyltransferase RsmH [Candidatus Omnitrophota bacterium]MDD5736750.1 16S rRNA (cytosine(1402)-N(4))-methyltransferase RsmH [Candidatus Omnitrophota bacterium]
MITHKPVLLKEVLEALEPAPGKTIVDCTVGLGGHAEAIVAAISPGGRLVGIDRDAQALEIAKERLGRPGERVDLIKGRFDELDAIFERAGIKGADGFLFDLGVSSMQFDEAGRGFSFRADAPLDMRMDTEAEKDAAELINTASEADLDRILEEYGEERFHRRIASAIAEERKKARIETTGRLVDIIVHAMPYKMRHGRVHAATRSFQAFRIAVNDELGSLGRAIDQAIGLLNTAGVICVISYHSLEDRIVKNKFREARAQRILELKNKKPVTPTEQEIGDNPRARSAKMRAATKMAESG